MRTTSGRSGYDAAPVGPLAKDRDAGVALEDETQGGAHEGIVVNDDNTYTALR